ncbi:MAG TPA: hypothetical protein VNB06_03630 [Thermoanaerobaculia bacterium]|nr:hypothetical protein [Thermoanaerobaculia bacterium]
MSARVAGTLIPGTGVAAGGAVAAAFGSALTWLCCLPFALGAAGGGVAAVAAIAGPWRPVLSGASLLLLGVAAFTTWRSRRRECATHACPTSRLTWLWLGAATLLVAVLLTLPRWSSWLIYWSL